MDIYFFYSFRVSRDQGMMKFVFIVNKKVINNIVKYKDGGYGNNCFGMGQKNVYFFWQNVKNMFLVD